MKHTHKTKENERKKYFRLSAHARSSSKCADVPGSSLFVHNDEIAYSINPGWMHGYHGLSGASPFAHSLCKRLLFVYPHHSDHEEMPLE